MEFIKEIFDGDKTQKSSEKENLKKAKTIITTLKAKNEELEIRLKNSEDRNKTIMHTLQTANTFRLMETIDDLKFELKENANEIKFYKAKLNEANEEIKRLNGKVTNTKQEYTGMSPIEIEKEQKKRKSEFLYLNQNPIDASFIIKEETSLSVQDQQIIELKAVISDLNTLYKDFDFYKEFYLEHQEKGQKEYNIMFENDSYEKAKRENKEFFYGILFDTKKEGYCIEIDHSGECFSGLYKNGKREGQGILETEETIFKGLFVDDEPKLDSGTLKFKTKLGTQEYKKKVTYTGEMLKEVPQGKGTLNFENGTVIEGSFVQGEMDKKAPISIKSLNNSTCDIPVELVPIEGIDAFIFKTKDSNERYIWNQTNGEFRNIGHLI